MNENLTPEQRDWISVEDELPITSPSSPDCFMSEIVVVKINSGYPFTAHLFIDEGSIKTYAYGKDSEKGNRITWLNPYSDIAILQNITHWQSHTEPEDERMCQCFTCQGSGKWASGFCPDSENPAHTAEDDPLTSPNVTWEELGRGFIEVEPDMSEGGK